MNWRRGFIRLWLVVATLWCLSVAGLAYVEVTTPRAYRTETWLTGTGPECTGKTIAPKCFTDERVEIPVSRLTLPWLKGLTLAVLPPAVLFGIGLVAIWIFAGFRQKA